MDFFMKQIMDNFFIQTDAYLSCKSVLYAVM